MKCKTRKTIKFQKGENATRRCRKEKTRQRCSFATQKCVSVGEKNDNDDEQPVCSRNGNTFIDFRFEQIGLKFLRDNQIIFNQKL